MKKTQNEDFERLTERTNEQVIQSIFESFVQSGRLADEVEYQLRSMGHDDLSQDQRKEIVDKLCVVEAS